MSVDVNHCGVLVNGLDLQRKEQKYVDFTLVSEQDDSRHPCHKVVLAAVSPYFETMFSIEMLEMEMNETIIGFRGDTIELILQYIYTGANVINVESVPDLYFAANYLQISTLQQECEKFLKLNREPKISLKIWQIAKLFKKYDVAEIAKGNVLQNFDLFCKVESIGEASFENMKELLHDKLTNCSGFIKCKAAWVWFVSQDLQDVQSRAKDVLNALASAENVEGSDILEACQNDFDQLLENVDFDTLTMCTDIWKITCKELWIESVPTACGTEMSLNECLIVLGGDPLEESKLTVFNYKKRQWYNVGASVTDLGHRYAICSSGSLLYLSGGLKNAKQFLCFQSETKTWSNQTELPVGREQHVMCTVPANTIRSERRVVSRKIYVLGGRSEFHPTLSDVHAYDIENMTWEKCGNIASPVSAACSAVVDKKIYLFGGVLTGGSKRSPTDLIQCFDTEKGYSWNLDLKLPIKAKSQKMSVVRTSYELLNDDVYVVHGEKVYKMQLNKKPKLDDKVDTIPNAPLKGFGAAGFGNRIFIFGGEDDNFKSTKNIIQYDTTTGQAITLPSHTPFIMKDFTYCDIPIPNSWDMTEYHDK